MDANSNGNCDLLAAEKVSEVSEPPGTPLKRTKTLSSEAIVVEASDEEGVSAPVVAAATRPASSSQQQTLRTSAGCADEDSTDISDECAALHTPPSSSTAVCSVAASHSYAQTTLSTWVSLDAFRNPQLLHFLRGLEYLVSLRGLQPIARRQGTDMQGLASQVVTITPTSSLPFLQEIVATAKSAAYRNRRWAPHKPCLSAVIEGAKQPDLTHGSVLRSLIIARIFAVSSRRLGTWQQPLSRVEYYDRGTCIYRPFGHLSHDAYVRAFNAALNAFLSSESQAFLDGCSFHALSRLRMKRINRLLGRAPCSVNWSSHIVLNDVRSILGPSSVHLDTQYMKSRSKGRGVPFNDGLVEWMRQRLNESPKVLQGIGRVATHEIYHLLCEARQWGVWRISQAIDIGSHRDAPSLVHCAEEMATYMLRQL